MTAEISYRGEVFEVRDGMTVRAAILKLGLSPESVLATRDMQLITDDEIIHEDERIHLIPVISGGENP
jgi:sulfur carrier protein ThiS